MIQNILQGVEEFRKLVGVQLLHVRLQPGHLLGNVAEFVYSPLEGQRQPLAHELASNGAPQGENIRPQPHCPRGVVVGEVFRGTEKLQGEGEAPAPQIFPDGFRRHSPFGAFRRNMEAYSGAFPGPQDVVVLPPHRHFFKFLPHPNRGGQAAGPGGQGGRPP
ncbi:hypothetical protein [Ralstonia solanacearum]|uniref:hypothetical protein n=1 Tax=Ralstonia solanacearum TaxID=305 RepID=UPI0011D1D770|nr:hypothetical protein [Ralstonia solanacearum]